MSPCGVVTRTLAFMIVGLDDFTGSLGAGASSTAGAVDLASGDWHPELPARSSREMQLKAVKRSLFMVKMALGWVSECHRQGAKIAHETDCLTPFPDRRVSGN